jgi:lauroyl/myristoyl acyltransferase
MSDDNLRPHLEVLGASNVTPAAGGVAIAAIGHFGNFEVLARVRADLGGCQLATTYKALKHPAADRVLQSLRRKSGILFFERTRDGAALRTALNRGNLILGLLADQHAGNRGLWIPFFGTPCSTNPAPAIYALRYNVPIVVGICYRVAPARWRLEFGNPIPTRGPDDAPRTPEELMLEVNRQYEAAIRRDPANWFWVHRRWKPPSPRQLSRARNDDEAPD